MINVALDIDFSTSPIHIKNGRKSKFCSAEGQKKLFKYRNIIFAGEFKITAMADTTSLSSAPLLEPKLSTSSSNF